MRKLFALLLGGALIAPSLTAQTLSQRLHAAADGTIRLSFAARPGVCADDADGIKVGHQSDEWQQDCQPRLVRVALSLRDHRVHSVRTYVGGRWLPQDSVVDLGTVGAREAAEYFLGLAEQTGVGGDLLLPAVLADSVTIWPSLVRIARNERLSTKARGRAVFWLGQAAGEAAGQALDSIAGDDRGDRDVRKQAIFALSQRDRNESVPALIRIARTNTDPVLRKTALFWLGQSEDPRAISLFEEILK
ncbi:MAG: lyase domain protein repeat-containing protein [Geminicoccaceae bacterium]|nr:lyase domain protein repeat-containing protein [Geminicoccaceae bacterium]